MNSTSEKFVTPTARAWLGALAIAGAVFAPVLVHFIILDWPDSDGLTVGLEILAFVAHVYGTLLAAVLCIWQDFPDWSKQLFPEKLREDLEKTFKKTSPVRKTQQRSYKRVFLACAVSGASTALGGLVGSVLGYALGYLVGVLIWPSEESTK
jgi:hypothetical protein